MNKKFAIKDEIFINQFSQQLHTLDEMREWFCLYSQEEKRGVIHNILYMFVQAHPSYEEIEEVAKIINKSKSAPAVKLLNRNKPYSKFGHELCNLPENELPIAFDILILGLAKADTRRKRQECINGCNHWWHKDLSNQEYLDYLIKQYNN